LKSFDRILEVSNILAEYRSPVGLLIAPSGLTMSSTDLDCKTSVAISCGFRSNGRLNNLLRRRLGRAFDGESSPFL